MTESLQRICPRPSVGRLGRSVLMMLMLSALYIPNAANAQQQATTSALTATPVTAARGSVITMTNIVSPLVMNDDGSLAQGEIAPSGSVSFYDNNVFMGQTVLSGSWAHNLLPFSVWGDGWNVQGSGQIVLDTAFAPDGAPGIIDLNSTNPSDTVITQDVDNTTPDGAYTFSIWLRVPTGTSWATVQLQDQNGTVHASTATVPVTTSWQRYTITGYVPSGVGVRVAVAMNSGGANVLQLWGAQLEQSYPGPYLKTTGAAQSATGTNYITSDSEDAWFVMGNSNVERIHGADLAPDGTPFTLSVDLTNDGQSYIKADGGMQPDTGEYALSTWAPGSYTFSVWLRLSSSNAADTFTTYMAILDQKGLSYAGVVQQQAITLTKTWKRYSVTATLPSGMLDVSAAIGGFGSAETGDDPDSEAVFDMWGPQLETGATPGALIQSTENPRSSAESNLLSYSQAQTGWTPPAHGGILSTPDSDPEGTTTAFSVVLNDTDLITQGGGTPDTTKPYAFSVWLRVPAGTSNTYIALYDQNGAQVTKAIQVTTDWRRYSVIGYLPSTSTTVLAAIGSGSPGSCSLGSFDVWGAQLEMVQAGGYVATKGTPQSGANAIANFSTSTLNPGSHLITARYEGDAHALSSISNQVEVDITENPAGIPAMTLSCGPAVLSATQTLTCTSQLPSTATGQVKFYIDAQPWGTPASISAGASNASGSMSSVSAGSHQLVAVYSGDSNFTTVTSSTTFTVTSGAPSMILGCTPNPAVLTDTLTCTVQFPVSATGTVSFYMDGSSFAVPVDAITSGSASNTWGLSGLTVGVHQITAVYSGDGANPPSTRRANVVVNDVPPTGGSVGTIYSYAIPPGGYDGNGNILSYSDTANGQWTLHYDNLNRLESAYATHVNGGPEHLCWTYDSFGNRLDESLQKGDCNSTKLLLQWASYDSANHITISSDLPGGLPPSTGSLAGNGIYDLAGNIIDDGKFRYIYNGDGKMCASQSYYSTLVTVYVYDADGMRIAKGQSSTFSCAIPSNFAPIAIYVPGANGVSDQYQDAGNNDGSSTWVRSFVYASSQLLATYESDNNIHYHLSDNLGSHRIQTAYDGTVEIATQNLPFGNGFTSSGIGMDADTSHFTDQERDAESGLDYFQARYYASGTGRFTSPDPSILDYADQTNPQSLNLYSYVYNNPLTNVDPSGMDACVTNIGGGYVEIDNAADGGTVDCAEGSQYISTSEMVTGVGEDGSGQVSIYGTDSGLYAPDGSNYTDQQSVTVTPDGGAFYVDLDNTINTPSTQLIETVPSVDQRIGIDFLHCASCVNTWKQSNCVVNQPFNTAAEDLTVAGGTAAFTGAAASQSEGGKAMVKGAAEYVEKEALGVVAVAGAWAHGMYKAAQAMVNGCGGG